MEKRFLFPKLRNLTPLVFVIMHQAAVLLTYLHFSKREVIFDITPTEIENFEIVENTEVTPQKIVKKICKLLSKAIGKFSFMVGVCMDTMVLCIRSLISISTKNGKKKSYLG